MTYVTLEDLLRKVHVKQGASIPHPQYKLLLPVWF